jgi:hypothetical protein
MMITFYTLEEAKAYAKKLLEETDYAILPDVNLTNKNDFVFYRNLIRILYISPRVTASWPEKPQAIWGESPSSSITNTNQPNTNLPTE